MLISTISGNENKLPFSFIKGNLTSDNPEQAFHDLRLHPDESTYIELNFRDRHTCVEYMAVSESHNSSEVLSPAILEEAENIMADLQRQMILKAIDIALDKGDQKLFMELWEQLNEAGVRYSACAN